MNRFEFFLFASLVAFIVFSSFLVIDTRKECYKCFYCKEVFVSTEGMALYNKTVNRPNTRVNGVYFEPDYFCVWTKDRTPEEINYTYCHESCHDMVYREWEHFCEDD
jgi:hypothetical protein